jgi:hypothetical protein
MTSIRTTCPRCGEVEMEAPLILLMIEPRTGEGTYSFACPGCEEVVQKPADRKIVELLRTAGVETAVTAGPARRSAQARHAPPPLTLDDLIDFHFLLSREDWFSLLMASAR